MPKPIQDPTVGQLLQRAFGLVGRVRPALDEVIIPVVNVADLARGAEVPRARQASAAFSEAAGGAGNISVARFEVPGNIIAVINWLDITSSAGSFVLANFGSTIPAPANVAAKAYTDGRLAGEQPAAVLTHGQDPAPALLTYQWRSSIGNTGRDRVAFSPKWVIGTGRPGEFGFLEFAMESSNQGLHMAIGWTEYQLT